MSERPRPPIIYVDTSVYCDLLVRNGKLDKDTGVVRWKVAAPLFQAINTGRVILAASALIEAEVACLAPYRDNEPGVHDKVRGWFTAKSTLWTDVDRFLARDAARLCTEWHEHRERDGAKLGGADATHLAAAVRLGADYLMTHDEGFPIGHVVRGVHVVRPAPVWVPTLDDVLAEDTASD